MDIKDKLADFDKIGTIIDQAAQATGSTPVVPASAGQKPPVKSTNFSPRKVVFGCLIFMLGLFAVLIIVMVFGLSAGEDTITNFGLEPTSFKNWTIGLVSLFFGTLALLAVVMLFYQVARRILAAKGEIALKQSTVLKAVFSLLFLTITIGLWYLTYSYINRFEMQQLELPIEIVTNPPSTTGLISPIQVQFSAERMTAHFKAGYDILAYRWDKDSDSKIDATGEKVTLYFPNGGKNNGVYDVILYLDIQPKAGGDKTTREYTHTVTISQQEIYGEIKTNFASGEAPFVVQFDASGIKDPDNVPIINYAWDIDNDSRPDYDGAGYQRVKHTFEKIGDHTVTLTVTSESLLPDGQHEKKQFSTVVTVREPKEFSEAEVSFKVTPLTGVAPLTISMDASGSTKNGTYKVDSYEWLIGDDLAKLSGEKNTFTFMRPGQYPVTLTVTYANGLKKNDSVMVQVNDVKYAPQAVIFTDPPLSRKYSAVAGSAPLVVKFNASQSKDADNNISRYSWDFDGDGIWDTEGSIVEYKYWKVGNFIAKLRVIDADGSDSTATIKIMVGEELPVIDFGASTVAGPAPLTIDFDASGSRLPQNKEIVSYSWDFNSDSRDRYRKVFVTESAQTTHIFDSIGEYIVKLVLNASDGTTYEDTLKIIATYPTLKAYFDVSRLSGKAPLAVSFDGTGSSGNIAKLEWVFNDGSVVNDEKQTIHVFREPGSYIVNLFIYDGLGNINSYSRTITVE